MRYATLGLLFGIALSGCATMAAPPPPAYHPVGNRHFMSPTPAIQMIDYSSGTPVTRYWASLPQAQVRQQLSLPLESATIEQISTTGTATFLPVSATFARGVYRVTYFYYRTRSEPCMTPSAGNLFSGIGIRMTANITTQRAGLNLTNLMGLAAAADRNEARGQLTIEAFGISSGTSSITPYLQASSGLTVEGLRKAIESFGVVKAIVDTPSVELTPYQLYIEGPRPEDCLTALSTAVATPG